MTIGPTPLSRTDRTPQLDTGLTLAQRAQLERDLADLPELADTLDLHRNDLLAHGTPTDTRTGRIPADLHVVDLTDRRTKDGPAIHDPIGEADLARRIGARRHGILPTLTSWVSLAAGEMHDTGVEHTPPVDPAEQQPTVTTEAGWLHQHLDWIGGQQWVTELAHDISGITRDLHALIGSATPDHDAVGTITELAASTNVPAATIHYWAARGWLTPLTHTRPRQFARRDVLAIRGARVRGKSDYLAR